MQTSTKYAFVPVVQGCPVAALVVKIIHNLVDHTEAVELQVGRSPDETVYRLTVAPHDVGKVIGKNGNTARALRILLSGMGMKAGRRLTIDIVEPVS